MDFRNTNAKARGIRNNNPGNLIKSANNWRGKVDVSQNTDSRFEQFVSVEYGAMMKNLISWYNRGLNTIDEIIKKWAPAFENNTANYIAFVSQQTGIGAKQVITKLDKDILIALSMAIAEMENGSEYKLIPTSLYHKAFEMIGGMFPITNTRKKKVTTP